MTEGAHILCLTFGEGFNFYILPPPAIYEHITRSIFGCFFGISCRDEGMSRYPSPSGFHFWPICCRSKTTFPAASKVLRLPQQKVPRCGHPMSLHQTPYVFSLKTLCLYPKHPMSLSQTPYVFVQTSPLPIVLYDIRSGSAALFVFRSHTCAPTRYTPVYPPDTHLCTQSTPSAIRDF